VLIKENSNKKNKNRIKKIKKSNKIKMLFKVNKKLIKKLK